MNSGPTAFIAVLADTPEDWIVWVRKTGLLAPGRTVYYYWMNLGEDSKGNVVAYVRIKDQTLENVPAHVLFDYYIDIRKVPPRGAEDLVLKAIRPRLRYEA